MNELQHPEHNHNCLDQSILIARRDNELPADEVEQVEQHIATCGECAANDRLITSGGSEVYSLLSALDPAPGVVSDPATALANLPTYLRETAPLKKSTPVLKLLLAKRKLSFG